jgi:hypothetical protein
VNNLKEELADLPNVSVIGDAGQLGRIPQAVEGGYKAALAL